MENDSCAQFKGLKHYLIIFNNKYYCTITLNMLLLKKDCIERGADQMTLESLNLFGVDFQTEMLETKDLPLYLTARRTLHKLSCENLSFVLIKVHADERFGVIAFEKQAAQLSEKYGMPVAFEFDSISRTQRDSLIKRNIPFIAGSDQLYLPFLGISLRNHFTHPKSIKAEKMMPVTQSLLLWLLYKSNGEPVVKKDAAEAIGVTRTSLTRASEQLSAMGLISQEKSGKEFLIKAGSIGIDLFRKAKPFLINPVQRIITVQNDSIYDQYPFSGESALAKRTMLNPPAIPVHSVWKSAIDGGTITEIDIRWETKAEPVRLELWKYDPVLFAKHGIADPISVAMSFENNVDERIEGAIEEYLEGYTW